MYCVLLLGSSGTGLRILCCRPASESRMAVVVCSTLSREEDEAVKTGTVECMKKRGHICVHVVRHEYVADHSDI